MDDSSAEVKSESSNDGHNATSSLVDSKPLNGTNDQKNTIDSVDDAYVTSGEDQIVTHPSDNIQIEVLSADSANTTSTNERLLGESQTNTRFTIRKDQLEHNSKSLDISNLKHVQRDSDGKSFNVQEIERGLTMNAIGFVDLRVIKSLILFLVQHDDAVNFLLRRPTDKSPQLPMNSIVPLSEAVTNKN